MRDLPRDVYRRLVEALKTEGYEFITFEKFLTETTLHSKIIIMRHDVDRFPQNAIIISMLGKSWV